VELTKLLLLINIVVNIYISIYITIILAMIYERLRKNIVVIHEYLEKINNINTKETILRLNKILEEVRMLKENMARIAAGHAESSKSASSTRTRNRGYSSAKNEEEGGIWLDLSDPAVRQWYEYLKRKFEKDEAHNR